VIEWEYWNTDHLPYLNQLFRNFCSQNELTVISLGADKHGSYVWEAGAQQDLIRFMTFAITEVEFEYLPPYIALYLAESRDTPVYLGELIIGADNGSAYTTQTVNERYYKSVGEFKTDLYEGRLLSRLKDAWNVALSIRPSQLVETYIMPRTPEGWTYPRRAS